jgi:gluconolactonase
MKLRWVGTLACAVAACSSGHGGGATGGAGAGGGQAGAGGGGAGGVSGTAGATAGSSGTAGGRAGTGGTTGSAGGTAGTGGTGTAGATGGAGGASGAGGSTGGSAGGTGGTTGAAGEGYHKATCPAGPYATPAGTNRQPACTSTKLAHVWNEGPVWVASEQAFFFSNFDLSGNYNGDIVKFTPATDSCEVWLANVGTNGMRVAPDGNLLAAVQGTQSITEYDLTTKKATVIVDQYMGKHFNSPNDLTVHSNGTIYFTDPDYQRGSRPMELPLSVYRIDPAGGLTLIETAKEPNGIALSPDERLLYVDQDLGGGIQVFDLDASGVPMGAPRPFAGVTDGLAMDCAGNLYLSAAGGIVSSAGMVIGQIPGGGGTHGTFGGPDDKTFFIVGGGSNVALGSTLATIEWNVPGIP